MPKEPRTRSLPPLHIVELARLEAEKSILAIQEQIQSSGILKFAEQAMVMAEKARKMQEIIKTPTHDFISFHIPAPNYSPQLSEERIANRVVNQLSPRLDFFQAKRSDGLIFLVIHKNTITQRSGEGKKCKLSPKRLTLFVSLSNDFRPTKALLSASVYKNMNTVRKTLGELNRIIMRDLELDDRLIEGDEGLGYRINERYRIDVDR